MTGSDHSGAITRSAPFNAAASDLRTFLEESVSLGLPGISVAVATRDGVLWADVAGMADVQAREVARTDLLFGIGSITKTFVTVVVLQLVEERRLRLDDTAQGILGAAAEGIANAHRVTVGELLSHTSGVPSWEDDASWIREGRGESLHVPHAWGKHETLTYIKGHPAVVAPGERYSYSNTNYTLLGMIVEKVTGKEAVIEIRERVTQRLGLKDIYLEGFEPVPVAQLPHRYHWATPDFCRDAGVNAAFPEVAPGLIDATGSNLSVEWTTGGMVATARDLACYGAGLRDGKLLTPESMRYLMQWMPARPGAQVGHGVFRWEYPGGLSIVGHDGNVLGFSAVLYWIEGADAVVAAMCNVGTMHSGEVPKTLKSVVKRTEFFETVMRLTHGALT